MGEYKTERKIVIDLQDYQHTDPSDEYVYQTRLLLNEYDSEGFIIGRNEILRSSKEDISYEDYSSIISSYLKGNSGLVQKTKSAILLDHGDQHIRSEGITQYLEKSYNSIETESDPTNREFDKLAYDWLDIFYSPLEKSPTVKEYVEYLDSISEGVLLSWSKRLMRNIAAMIDPDEIDLTTEEYITDLLNDHVLSNESWSTGFFEHPAFDTDSGEYVLYLPDVVEDYLEKHSTYRVDTIMKEHKAEIIKYALIPYSKEV